MNHGAGEIDTWHARHSRVRSVYRRNAAETRGRCKAASKATGSSKGSLCCREEVLPSFEGIRR